MLGGARQTTGHERPWGEAWGQGGPRVSSPPGWPGPQEAWPMQLIQVLGGVVGKMP